MRAILGALVALTLLSQAAACAEIPLGEGTHRVSETIAAGDYRAYVVEMGRDDALKVRLSEPTGARIDVFLTNYSAYMVYKNAIPGASFDFYYLGGEFSAKSVSDVDYTYYSLRADTMVLIVDNANKTDEGAAGSSPVEVVGTITLGAGLWGLWEYAAVGAVALAMVAVVALAFGRRRRRGGRPPSGRPGPRPKPARQALRPVRRSDFEKRKPLSPKRRWRGR